MAFMKNIVAEKTLAGYKIVRMPNHPRRIKSGGSKDFVHVHILEAEKMLGRQLKRGECVHHKDFNRQNNAHENLIVFSSNSDHFAFHRQDCDESLLIPNGDGTFSCKKVGNAVKTYINDGHGNVTYRYIVGNCIDCGAPIGKTKTNRCPRCASIRSRKVADRPSAESIIADMLVMPMVDVAKKYGVSDNAVRKWMIDYGYTKEQLNDISKMARKTRPKKQVISKSCRAVDLIDEDGNVLESFPSVVAAAKSKGCSVSGIYAVLSGRQSRAGGMYWSPHHS